MSNIESAQEFYRLRTSEVESEYTRAAEAAASIDVWMEVIRLYPDMRQWVAHNKTVQLVDCHQNVGHTSS